ncbi:hypothetical protein ACIBCH_09745 [Amycolatopsis thailandensis]|uniref:hypothetical protein n=1 Tax=Amycolatopsis thailandensis TaxID=589330 RepID=UPI00379F8982
MTWFKVDDKLRGNRKVRKLRGTKPPRRLRNDLLPAMGLWTICGTWASDNLSDGFVPADEVHQYDLGEYFAQRLVEAGMWFVVVHDGEPGYQFHDWHEFNPLAEKVKESRRAAAERQKRWRESKRNGVSNASRNGVSNASPTRPDPTPPKGGRGGGRNSANLRPVPEWCGTCDERTRQIELDDGTPKRCPDCNPNRETA